MAAMALESDDEYERVEMPSDSESEAERPQSSPRKSSVTTPSTPATNTNTPYCREKRLTCPYEGCDKAFNRPVRLEEHIRSHTNERPFKCHYPLCDKNYLRESHLKHHIKSAHTDVRDYTCSHEGCGKSFATGQRLRVHEATHDAPNKYICRDFPPCNQVFRKKDTLQRHILTVHESQEPFACTKVDSRTGQPCKKSFDTQYKLSQHERQMHDPTRFSCTECIVYNESLTSDPTINDLERASKCKIAYFTTHAEFQAHNAQEHPPTCQQCSLSFNTAKELTRHNELIHEIINPNANVKSRVTCPYEDCGKTFSKKGNLNVHIRTTHENRRDFICGITDISLGEIAEGTVLAGCGRDFGSKTALVDHVRSVHLGLESKNQKKRRLRESTEGPNVKKARKDKDVRKKSIAVDAAAVDRYPFMEGESEMPEAESEFEFDGQELDGNTTMVGSMLFDPSGAYRYVSGVQTPVEQESTFAANDAFPLFDSARLSAKPDNVNTFAYSPTHFEDELDLNPQFPSAFTLEPEMSNALDPMLFLSTPSQSRYRYAGNVN